MQGNPDIVGRRRFLRLVTGAALSGTVSPLLAGCSGSGSSGSSGNTGNNGNNGGQVVPADSRMASLGEVQSFINSVSADSRENRITRIATFLKGRSEFAQSGSDEDSTWAIYPDGVPLTILANRVPDPAARSLAQPPLLTRRTDVPTPRKARLVYTLPPGFTSELPVVQTYLQHNGYQVTIDPGTVNSLKTVAGDGVFYMGSHGGLCRVSQRDAMGNLMHDATGAIISYLTFGAWTSSLVDPANPNEFLVDLRAGGLGFGMVTGDAPVAGAALAGLYYVITDAFVQHYMKFDRDSLVWFSACRSNSDPMAQPFAAACLASGAGLYVGWNSTVADAAVLVADKFILPRLLGEDPADGITAPFPKEDPAQRAFDYAQVWDELKSKNLNVHPNGFGGTTEIKFTAGTSNFALLAPAIKYVLINEPDDEALLRGQFGTPDPGDRSVLIGGQTVDILDWTEDRVRVRLARTGEQSMGDVQVIVREHKSNIRRITAWDMTFRYKWTAATMPELKVEGPMTLRFRADIGTYREKPGEAPKEVLRTTVAGRDAKLDLTASGVHGTGNGTISWTGAQTFVSSTGHAGDSYILAGMFLADTFLKNGKIGLALGAKEPPFTQTITTDRQPVVSKFVTSLGLLDGAETFPDPLEGETQIGPLPALNFTFDDKFGILAGTHNGVAGQLHLEWDAIEAQSPPDPKAARSVSTRR